MPRAFHVQSRVDSTKLIIASDFFAAVGRAGGGFGDLVPRLRANLSVWETAPPPAGTEVGMSAGDHMDRWLADVRASGHVVHAVFGFCVGSVFAAALVEQIATWQGQAPRLIVFDPERPHAALLHRHFGDALRLISKALSTDDMAAAIRAGEAATAASSGLAELATRLSDILTETGDPALRKAGLNAGRRAELLDTFSSFLSYLAASSAIDPTRTWLDATAISSATPRNGLNVLPAGQRAKTVAREIRFDVQHTDLLRSADVAQTVRELLI
jgi:hypothetical protein